MSHIPARALGRWLLRRQIPRGAVSCPQCAFLAGRLYSTTTTTPATPPPPPPPRKLPVPLRKQIKDEAKARKAAKGTSSKPAGPNRAQTVPGWELTVGIEIHAQLNTERKLFSPAQAPAPEAATPAGTLSPEAVPNSKVAFFDLALPGAQPLFQPATLIPAIRAALALHCDIQPVSRFDRKHYFHWDQPTGYQITQYYEPFARGGYVDLPDDGREEKGGKDGKDGKDEKGTGLRVPIVQVQMEQDTAKTVAQPGGVHWLDFNRVGVPLVEIITAPALHRPAAAAALVRKVQALLHAVDACTAGMEAGGLRADVNVSVRRTGLGLPLGVRTEIKNLNSFRAVEDAVIAERNRQIAAIEAAEATGLSPQQAARTIASETRGWAPSPGGDVPGETFRLRGKEGEVDYRYMPDPDLAPVVIDEGLVRYLALTLGVSPDDEHASLVADHGLTPTDAAALMQSEDKCEYYYAVVQGVEARLAARDGADVARLDGVRPFVANWVLHQLGRLTSERNADAATLGGTDEGASSPEARVPVDCLADILAFRYKGRITAAVAKELLYAVYRGDVGAQGAFADVADCIDRGGLWFDEIAADEYSALAEQALDGEDKTLRQFEQAAQGKGRYPQGKLQFLVGKLLRLGPEGRTDPQHAEAAVRAAIEQRVGGHTP